MTAFSTREASAAGVSRSRLRGRDLETPFAGIRRPVGAHLDLIRAYLPRLKDGQFFSHVTAARPYGMYLPSRLAADDAIHVSALIPQREPRTTGVIGHRLQAGTVEIVTMDGIPLSSAVDTWCLLAPVLTVDELVIAGDGLVCREHPLATMEIIQDAVTYHARHRGVRSLAAAASLVRPNTDSPTETRLRLAIVRAGLPEPVVNARIETAAGEFIAFGDLVYRQFRLVLEYDGEYHFDSPDQHRHDIDRLERIMAEDWRVVRIHREHLRNGARPAVHLVRRALLAQGWRA